MSDDCLCCHSQDIKLHNGKWHCLECGAEWVDKSVTQQGHMPNEAGSRPAPGRSGGGSNPPCSTPELVRGEVVDAQGDGEVYVALWRKGGHWLVGASLFKNPQQIAEAFKTFAPERLLAVKVNIPKEETK